MKNIITLLIIFIFATNAVAQQSYNPEGSADQEQKLRQRSSRAKTDANVSGHTVDRATDEHLGFITIAFKGTTIGTATDATGHYFLKNLPEGEYSVVASAVGYKPIERKIKLVSGKTVELNFEMEEDAIMLNNVVVTANRGEASRREASSIVNVISTKLFENTNSVCLAQGLNFQPGLRVENNCQNCGFQQVRINGLEGPYTQILIDSRPIFSALAGVYGIEQIPANMIDRVEVMRGGGSALFGSNAIAGTINIITKEPLNNSLTISNNSMLIGGKSSDITNNLNASLVSDDHKAGVSIYASARERDYFDANGDGFSEIGLINARSIGLRSYYKLNTQSKLTLEYHTLGEFRRGGNLFDLPPHETDITEQTDHNIHSGGLKYDFISLDSKHRLSAYVSAQDIRRQSYYGAGQDLNAYGNTTDLSFVTGAQHIYSMDKLLFMPADLTSGIEYSFNHMLDKMLGYNRKIDQKVNIMSAFIQNEWKNKKASLLLGVRADKHNLIDEVIISPRISGRYDLQDWVSLRAGFATGFRAPQAFDEDLHLTAVGGGVSIIRIAEDLETERSKSFNVSADFYKTFGKVQTNFLIEGFYTRLDNVFLLEEVGHDENDNIELERRNGAGAVVKGINMEARVVPATNLQLQAGATLQQSRYTEPEAWSSNEDLEPQTIMFRSPDKYAYLTATYNPVKQLSVSLSGTYTGSMLVQHFAGYVEEDREVWTPQFVDVNMKLAYDINLNGKTKLQLNGGVQNIFNSYQTDFDEGADRDAGYMYGPSLPRSYFVGLKFSI